MTGRLQPLAQFPAAQRRRIDFVLSDLDDTLTENGHLVAAAYLALAELSAAGLKLVLVTGRPAGWCDHLARMWPLSAVIGENGAFYFSYDPAARKMRRRYWFGPEERARRREALRDLAGTILKAVPGAALAADQAFRETDLAIDFCEDVPPLPPQAVQEILRRCQAAGLAAKMSSIHVNAWFGDYDKLAMTRIMFQEVFNLDLDAIKERITFSGDSPNDQPMFAFFPNSVGVANVTDFLDHLSSPPTWVTPSRGGQGFAELAQALLSARRQGGD